MSRYLSPVIEHLRTVTLVSALVLLADPLMPWGQLVSAEPEKLPKKFYERNFAGAPGGVQGDEIRRRPSKRATQSSGSGDTPARGSQPDAQASVVGAVQQQADSASRRATKSPTEKRQPLLISVVVNSLNREHFQRVINEAIRLHDSRIAVISSIDHIGDCRAVTPEIEAQLYRQRGIVINQIDQLPARYGVSLSPLWIVHKPEGLHLATGGMSIDSMINEFGEYDLSRARRAAQKMDEF